MACHKNTGLIIEKNFNGRLYIKEWKAIGPFEFDTLRQYSWFTYDNKDLKPFGIDEENFEESDFNKLASSKFKAFIIPCRNNSMVKLLDYVDKEKLKNKSSFYLYTNVYSEVETEVVFIIDGSSSYKIWVNKKEILEELHKWSTSKIGDRFVRVHLHKGNNSVFAKVNRSSNEHSWALSMVVASENEANKVYKWNYLRSFVTSPYVSDSLNLYFGHHSQARLQIIDENNNPVMDTVCHTNSQKSVCVNSKQLQNGLHLAKLYIGLDTLQEYIFKGNLSNFIAQLKAQVQHLKCGKPALEDMKTVIARIDFLLESKYPDHRNILFYTNMLNHLLTYVKKNNNDSLIPGTIFKTYYSKEDNKVVPYLFHTNKECVMGDGLPLIIFVPYASNEESLLRSWYISNLDQIEVDIKFCDNSGFALAWPFLKGKNYTHEAAYEEIKEVIKSIRNNYNIDTTKIYLEGECVGGQRALLLAERCPDLFSGVVVRAPVTLQGEGNSIPINFVQNLFNIPVCIKHGKDDKTVSINDTKKFIKKAQEVGNEIKFIEEETGHLELSRDERRYAFEYLDSLKNYKKQRPIYKIKYCTYEDSASIYWIRIKKGKSEQKTEVLASFDPLKYVFNIQTKNVSNYSILFNKLNLSSKKNITVYTNNILIYKGIALKMKPIWL
jgi:hypothetical protein